jgi:phenylpropionate dioxygenase-like ring-hydroxylating dioxygenase large terminal subunit
MYPFRNDNVFLRNCWYVAAFNNELDAGPIERVILDEPVVLFRMADATPAAMFGICPHRYYPLGRGKVVGDSIQCGYHGFEFDGRSGSCVKIPSQNAVPGRFRQKIYPAVEHGPWIWIWPGEPELAHKDLLPPLAEIGVLQPDWRVDHVGLLPTAGRAQLLVENLLDLTHVAFLHGAFVDGAAFLQHPVEIVEQPLQLMAHRQMRSAWVAGFYDLLFGPQHRFQGSHLAETQTVFYSPGYIRTNSGVIHEIEGRDSVDRSVFGEVRFHHILTPETAQRTHYFSTMSRNYRLDDNGYSIAMGKLDYDVRMQDVVAVGEIEGNLQRFSMHGPELLARSDAASMRVRKRMQEMLDAERL